MTDSNPKKKSFDSNKTRITFYPTHDMKEALEILATKDERSVNYLVIQAIKDYIKKIDYKKKFAHIWMTEEELEDSEREREQEEYDRNMR